MPDQLDHHNSICLVTDPYSNKHWNQQNHYDHSKQDLYGPLKYVYNRMTYYGEQRLTLYIINYVVNDLSKNNRSRRRSYRSRTRKEKQKKRHASKGKPLKCAYPTECCIMKRKNGECHMKAKLHAPDLLGYLDSICPNPNPLERTH